METCLQVQLISSPSHYMCVMSLPTRPVLSSPWAVKGFILLLSGYADFRTSLCMTGLVSLHGAHLRNWWEHRFLAPHQAGPVKVILGFSTDLAVCCRGWSGRSMAQTPGMFSVLFLCFHTLSSWRLPACETPETSVPYIFLPSEIRRARPLWVFAS